MWAFLSESRAKSTVTFYFPSEHFKAIDRHLYVCKKNVSFHISAFRELGLKRAFCVSCGKNFASNVTGLGLNPSFKMAVIEK